VTGQAGTKTAALPGERIFAANCVVCHPNGSNVVAPELALKKAKQLGSLDTFIAFIRAPKMPDGSQGGMPAFPEDLVSNAQAGDLYKYIQSMLPVWK
jgi:mono/diheme cytochrome c family protein